MTTPLTLEVSVRTIRVGSTVVLKGHDPADPTQHLEVIGVWSDAHISLIWTRWKCGYGFQTYQARDVDLV